MRLRNRLCKEYVAGVKSFMDTAKGCKDENNCVRCPCRDCQNAFFKPLSVVQAHLYEFGIAVSYDKWIFHGEEYEFVDTGGFNVGGLHMNHENETNIEDEGDDEMYGLMHDMLGSTSNDRVCTETLPEYDANPMSATDEENIETLSTLFSEGRRNLFLGCTNIPCSTYDAKKMLKDLGLGYEARLDLADLKIRRELHLQRQGNGFLKPPATYTLTLKERKEFCQFLKSVKFPDGYASNISKCVNDKEGKLIYRVLHRYKTYVKNKARPEGSIAEAYIVNESLTFCSMYLHSIETQFNRIHRNDDGGLRTQSLSIFSQQAQPFGGVHRSELSRSEIECAHCKHREMLKREHNTNNVDLMQQQLFPKWFESHMRQLRENGSAEASDELYSLSNGPDFRVCYYPGCVVNGVRYLVTNRDAQRTTQNSGVMVLSEHDNLEISFYGVLISIVEGLWDIQEKDVVEVQYEHVFYQQNESCDTVLKVQHDNLESQLFHRDDVNADVIQDPSLHEEMMVTTQNMDHYICDENEEDETIEDYCSDETNELQSEDDSDLDHNIP
ncbi:hypothetical protein JRO89_XS05G0117500 [Xanthoceras sorbifolium]|uniref:Transposase-associated domain-containing protein n=1 Tax=Xanthoceras sorbifolium TaxID=99658 RepID=A0ABQ8I1J5_9ROSI|nr:hypothetical protein JRO89_XS05G0117500 [Xanthoceras sorbifolium]